MHLTHGLHRYAQLTPADTALVGDGQRHDWRSFRERVARLAGGLRAAGLGPGDRVAMLSHNSTRYVEFFFAAFWAGGVAVPVNTRWAEPEMLHALTDSGARILLADADHASLAATLAAQAPELGALVHAASGAAPAGMVAYEALIDAHAPVADAMRGYEDLACLFYTGGTTGRSKGVMLSHRNLVANSMTAMLNMGIRQHSVHLHVSPLFHVAGGSRLFSVTLAGGTHVVVPRFEPESFLGTIERERVSITVVVPTMLARLVALPDLQRFDLSSLDLLCYGASPMPEALLRRTMERIPGVRFLQSYGMTELSPVASVLTPAHHVFDGPDAGYTASAGQPVYNADIRIVNDADEALPTGAVGEVCVRGPMVMQGYWQQPELTAQTLRGGWMHTGDAGYLDERGFLFVVDRVKDMIVSGGENVYSAEVEDALHKHPDVAECAVIGVPSDTWGESVHAVVVPHADTRPTAEVLMAHCRELIAGYKCPRSIDVRLEELPKSGPGKILKTELRRPFWEGRERGVS